MATVAADPGRARAELGVFGDGARRRVEMGRRSALVMPSRRVHAAVHPPVTADTGSSRFSPKLRRRLEPAQLAGGSHE